MYRDFKRLPRQNNWIAFLYALKNETHPNSASAIELIANFSLGLRVEELAALKWKDLKSSYLQIRRMKQKQYDKLENGKWKSYLEVVEHTKSDVGNRISSKSITKKYDKYRKALGIIKKTNHKARKTCLTKIADNTNINLKDAMEFGIAPTEAERRP